MQPLGALGPVLKNREPLNRSESNGMMVGSDGFDVLDSGMDGPIEKFIKAFRSGIDIVGKSKLVMTIPAMPDVY
jgi:hypothetical protein